MVLLMIPGFWLMLFGLAAIPTYGDGAAFVAALGFFLMLIGAIS